MLPPSSTITALVFLIFCLPAIKNSASNRSCTSVRDQQLAALNISQVPWDTAVCHTLFLTKTKPSIPSVHPSATSHRPLVPLTLIYVLKTLFHCNLFPDILPMPTVQRASGVVSTTSYWSYHYQAAHKHQHGRLHFDQH